MNRFGVSWLIIMAANAVLLFLLTWVNQTFAVWSISIYLPAAFVLLTAIHGNNRVAFGTALITGLFIDALSPLPYFSQTFILVLCTTVLMGLRQRIRAGSILQATAIGVAANALAFCVLTLLVLYFSPLAIDLPALLRIVTDLALSQLAFLTVTPWFLEFQKSILHLIGINLAADEPRES